MSKGVVNDVVEGQETGVFYGMVVWLWLFGLLWLCVVSLRCSLRGEVCSDPRGSVSEKGEHAKHEHHDA